MESDTNADTDTYTNIESYICTCQYMLSYTVCVYIYRGIGTQIGTNAHVHMCLSIYIYISLLVHIHTYIHIYIYIQSHIYIETDK